MLLTDFPRESGDPGSGNYSVAYCIIHATEKYTCCAALEQKLRSQSKKNPNVKTSGDIPDYEL
jgi:hypothetical protein